MRTCKSWAFLVLLLTTSHMIKAQIAVPAATTTAPATTDPATTDPAVTDPAVTDPAAPTVDPPADGTDPYSGDSTYSPTDGSTTDPSADPTAGQCKSQYHTVVASPEECTSNCQAKVTKANGNAIVDPTTYDNNGLTCCNCRFKRTAAPTAPPGAGSIASGGISSSTDDAKAPLDPTKFKQPTQEEIAFAIDPSYPTTTPEGTSMVYTVLRIIGMPWTLPLPFDQQVAFIYALSNTTGLVWQYMGAAPSQPNVYPSGPPGIPPVKGAGAPPTPPQVALPPPVVPVPDPNTLAPLAAPAAVVPPVDPAAVVPPTDPAAVVPPTDPAAVVPPTDPAAVVPPTDPAAATVPPTDPAGRRMLRSTLSAPSSRRLMQAAPPDYADYSPPSPPTDGTVSPAEDGSGDTSSPGGDSYSPPQDGSYSPPTDAAPTDVPTDPAMSPPVVLPSPPVVMAPPPVFMLTAPPAAPAIPLPADMDGIWYFARKPMDATVQLKVSRALAEATAPGGSQAFVKSLQAQGITAATDAELRYIGTAPQGYLDVTKRLEGDIFGSTTVAAPPPPPSKMSTSTMAAIIGGVVGGVCLLALLTALFVSFNRRGKKQEREALTQQWKMERELAENEKRKLAAANSTTSSSRFNASHDAGFVAMTRDDIERQRSERRAETMEAATRISSMKEPRASPSGKLTPKVSRIDSMRSALGLNRISTAISNRSSRNATPPVGDNGFDLFPSSNGANINATSANTPSRQFSSRASSGRNLTSTPEKESKSGWGRMFSKKPHTSGKQKKSRKNCLIEIGETLYKIKISIKMYKQYPMAILSIIFLVLSLRCRAETNPDQVQILLAFRDSMLARPQNQGWKAGLSTWRCPTPQDTSFGSSCDPCGREAWGNFDHVGCRGAPMANGEFKTPGTGEVTNIHITDFLVEGPVPLKELCPLKSLREFDLDGGTLSGSISSGFAECFPDLREIDLSYNRLTGTIPPEIANVKTLKQFKAEVNDITGSIPSEFGSMPLLNWLRFAKNKMSGPIPSTFSQTSPHLYQLLLDNNDFEGNLHALANHSFVSFSAHANPKLCGMVPIGVRYAHGFNFYNTKLGVPCNDETL